MSSISVFSYKDFRLFLSDKIEEKRNNNPKLSYRVISKKIGYSSPNFILLVIQGKRNLSPKSIGLVSKFLDLNRNEKNYFKILVLMNQASTFEEKLEFSKQLLTSKMISEKKHITADLLSYYSTWLNVVIREMTLLEDFEDNPDWIIKRLGNSVTKKQISDSLRVLFSLDLIERKNGKIKATTKDVRAPDEVRSDFIRAFHLEMILRASKALTDLPPELRDVTSITLPVNLETIPDLKKQIEDFRSSIAQAVSSLPKTTEVYQLNIQLFPITKIQGK